MRKWLGPVLLLAFGLVPAQAQSAPSWSWQGPATWHLPGTAMPALGGQLNTVIPNPNVPGGAWAGGMGGVWAFAPGAWSPTALAQPVTALALAADGSLLAGTSNGLLRSTTGGVIWAAPAHSPFTGVAVHHLLADASGNVWAATAAGLYQSPDSGATWTQLASGETWDVAESGATVLAASTAALAAIPQAGWKAAALCANPQGGFYVLTAEPVSLWALTADGKTATAVPLPAGFQDSVSSLAIAAGASGLWLGGSAGVFTSTTAGQSWSAVGLAAGTSGVHAIALAAGPGGWIATDTGLFSLSGQDLNAGLTNFAARGLVLAPTGLTAPMAPAMVAGGAYGNRDWSIGDNQSAWSALADCRPLGGDEWALDTAGRLWKFTAGSWLDTGTTVFTVLGCTADKAWALPAPAGAIAPVSDAVAYVGSGPALQYTADGGTTWATLATLPAPIIALARDPVHTNVLAVAVAGGGVSVSLDNGGSWVASNGGLPGAPITALAFDSAENLWASTLGRGIWMVPLAGASRSLTLQGLPAAPVAPGAAVALTATYTALGAPVANAGVTFSFSQGAQSAGSIAAVTDAAGVAQAAYTSPDAAGPIAVLATVAGIGGQTPLSASGQFTVAAGPPMHLTVTAGAGQRAVNGTTLPQAIVLRVTDAFNNPIAGVAIALSAPAGAFNTNTLTTGADGGASATYTLPTAPGQVTLTAVAAGLSASWSETALPTPDFSLALAPPAAPPLPNTQAALAFTVNPLNGWTQPVAVTCTAPVPGCTISGGQVLYDTGGGGDVTVTISGQAAGLTRTASLDVSVQGISMSIAGSGTPAVSIHAGQSQQVPVAVTPINQASGTVTLALQQPNNLPANLSLAFTPASPIPLPGPGSGGAISATLTVAATASGALPPWPFWLGLGLLAVESLRRRKRALALAALALALAGCGGAPAAPARGNSQPVQPAPSVATYSVTVVATCVSPRGAMQATLPLTVTVTQ